MLLAYRGHRSATSQSSRRVRPQQDDAFPDADSRRSPEPGANTSLAQPSSDVDDAGASGESAPTRNEHAYSHPLFSLNLMRPAKVFLLCSCIAECVLIVPNVAAELHMAKDGPHVAICRICLFIARMSLVVAPGIARLVARCGRGARQRLDDWAVLVCGTACGSVEPSRGIATALAGWYLISTPMHDAFGAQSANEAPAEDGPAPTQKEAMIASGLLVPCAMIMAANVCLFLCDALMLTVAPLLRQQADPTASPRAAPRPAGHPQVFRFGAPDSAGREKEKEFSPTCVICLSDFEAGESLARLPCRHVFHTECVGEWLVGHGTCPMRCVGYVLPPHAYSEHSALVLRRAWQTPGTGFERDNGEAPPELGSERSPRAIGERLRGRRGLGRPAPSAAPPAVVMGVAERAGDEGFGGQLFEEDSGNDEGAGTPSLGSLATEELMQEAQNVTSGFSLPSQVPQADHNSRSLGASGGALRLPSAESLAGSEEGGSGFAGSGRGFFSASSPSSASSVPAPPVSPAAGYPSGAGEAPRSLGVT